MRVCIGAFKYQVRLPKSGSPFFMLDTWEQPVCIKCWLNEKISENSPHISWQLFLSIQESDALFYLILFIGDFI